MPTRVSGIRPWYRCRSDPQIAARVTRTIASFGCSMGGTSFSSTRIRYGPRYTIARIGPPGEPLRGGWAGPRLEPDVLARPREFRLPPAHRRQTAAARVITGLLGR